MFPTVSLPPLSQAILESAGRELADELTIILLALDSMNPESFGIFDERRQNLIEAKRAAWCAAAKAELLWIASTQGPKLPCGLRKLADLVPVVETSLTPPTP